MPNQMPELPLPRRNRFVTQYKISEYDANLLTEHKAIADYFEQVAVLVPEPGLVSNWIINEILHIL